MECDVTSYHIGSFNYLLDEGIHLAALDVPPAKMRLTSGDGVEISYTSASVGYPTVEKKKALSSLDNVKLYPSECRQRGMSYKAPIKVGIEIKINGIRTDTCDAIIGEIPIMLMSNRCHLNGLSKKNLLKHGEEETEKGGYFISKGYEKVLRLLVATRRNYPLASIRQSFKEKGQLFTQYGVMMRCIKENHSAALMTLHYLENGSITICLQFRRELFYLPLMCVIKALVNKSDRVIYDQMVRLRPKDHFWSGCVAAMLLSCQEEGISDQESALIVLGSKFRVALNDYIGSWEDDKDAARFLLNVSVAIHLKTNEEKFHLLTYMSQKLIALVKKECANESQDNPQFQEASVSGHIILLIIRERLENALFSARRRLEMIMSRKADKFVFSGVELLRALTSISSKFTHGLEYFFATGNLVTKVGLSLQQTSGFAVIAERINQLRFISHFRAIHRGAFFTEMRTTDVRKLRPEAWGFICPVHTPDGAPCGLLNHVTASTRIVTHYVNNRRLIPLLVGYGMLGHDSIALCSENNFYPVLIDGNFVGIIRCNEIDKFERTLRSIKIDEKDTRLSDFCEIINVKHSLDPINIQTQYPGLYIFLDPGRLMRPVKNLRENKVEYIGTFEQVYLSICIDPKEYEEGITYHQELHPSCLFSFAANLIPFPDHNQSPRNVYQCQMGKQSMGVPIHSWNYRADNKMYRLQFPQDPLVQLEAYKQYDMHDYPLGTNACVAVISYTGYDMEDAMVINKGSYQRGFAHGTVIKVERINLRANKNDLVSYFSSDPQKSIKSIDIDGLPIPGRLYKYGDPYYSVYDSVMSTFKVSCFKYSEAAYCGLVRILEEENLNEGKCHALIQWRIERNPIIGDKFASRAGQKGINSFLWPAESLPFSENGVVPDIIFNPHGFPSRMTIGMMIESMAGKAAAMHGCIHDASPFVFNEKNTAIDYFGDLLTRAGYNYYGNEVMYSGVDGREMEVQIFFGIVYYQRLRHMIADKFQVRSSGSVDPVTLQPIKGRKKGGGVRFGEMERDALISHGISFSLQDRLLNCSDKDNCYICTRCGSLISILKNTLRSGKLVQNKKFDHSERQFCLTCKKDDKMQRIEIPRIFRYLVAELAALNIQVELDVKDPSLFCKIK